MILSVVLDHYVGGGSVKHRQWQAIEVGIIYGVYDAFLETRYIKDRMYNNNNSGETCNKETILHTKTFPPFSLSPTRTIFVLECLDVNGMLRWKLRLLLDASFCTTR